MESAISSVSKWIDGLKETDNIPQYIISGLVKGLKSGISAVANVMIELGKSILNVIKGVLGITPRLQSSLRLAKMLYKVL